MDRKKIINQNLHIFIKYNDKTEIEGIQTMPEHLKIYLDKGKFCWGHFTNTKPSRNKVGLWNQRTPKLDEQLSNGETTLVFFYSRVVQELYVGTLLAYYDRDYPSYHPEILELIPKYYHNRVGKINEKTDINTMRSYAFVEVTNIRKIDINSTDMIYNFKGDFEALGKEKVLESKGMASLLYVNLEENFYEELQRYQKNIRNIYSNNNIDNDVTRNNDEELIIGNLNTLTIAPHSKDIIIKESTEKYGETRKSKSGDSKKDYVESQIKNERLGLIGEMLTLKMERERVRKEFGEDYVDRVKHISKDVGDKEGYDVLSIEKLENGDIVEKYIEVKTTEFGVNTPFIITSNEVNFSRNNSPNYYLYRIYNYDRKTGNADYYIIEGNIKNILSLVPKNYVAYFDAN